MVLTIVVTGVGAVIGYGVIKSIRASRTYGDSRVIGLDNNPDSIGFYKCDRHYSVEKISSPGYIDTLIKICRNEAADVFMPLIEDEYVPVYNAIHRFKDLGIHTIIQPRGILETFMDKYLTAMALRKAGIQTPETLLLRPENKEEIARLVDEYGLPLILKPRRSRSSKGVVIVNSVKKLYGYMELLKDDHYVVQEYLPSDDEEYTCAAFKTPMMDEPYVISFKRQLLNGTTMKAEVSFDEALSDVCRNIARQFPFEGSMNVQLRKKDGIPCVFEINPRYSSTTSIRSLCGFNDVEMGIDYFMYKRVNGMPHIKKYKVIRFLEDRRVKIA